MLSDNGTLTQVEFDQEYKAYYEPYGLHLNKVLLVNNVF